MRKTVRLLLWVFACFCCGVPAALAGPIEEMTAFFRPATGVVIMPAGDEYLIDLDAAKGVRVGDLLTVVIPGEKVIHPVSGEVLGNLDALKGIFQVTRVKTGYSYIRPVGKADAISRGDTVRLWDQVPAAFVAENGGDDTLGRQLQAALPHLDWRGEAKDLPLTFVASPARLEMRGPDGTALKTVVLPPITTGAGKTVIPPVSPAVGGIVPAPAEKATTAIIRNEQATTEGLWMSPEFSGEAVGVHVADFDGDGQQEVALAFPHRLELGRIAGGVYSRLSSLDLGFGQKTIALDGADLDGNGRGELYLTAARDGELHSLVAVFDAGELKIVQNSLPWYLRAIDLPGEGRVLLGQQMGRLDEDFAGPIFRMNMQKGKLAEGQPVAVPQGIGLFGFLPLAGNADTMFLHLNIFDELKVVDSNGQTLWKSEEKAGGSEAFIERPDPSKNPASGPATRNAFMQARLLPGPEGAVLIPVNEGSRILSRVRSFDKSSIRAMSWNGFALQELWHTQPQNGYLADYRMADADNDGQAEIVQALVFSRDGLMSRGRSALAVFELQP